MQTCKLIKGLHVWTIFTMTAESPMSLPFQNVAIPFTFAELIIFILNKHSSSV